MPDSPRLIRVLLHPASQGRSSQDRHGLCPGGPEKPQFSINLSLGVCTSTSWLNIIRGGDEALLLSTDIGKTTAQVSIPTSPQALGLRSFMSLDNLSKPSYFHPSSKLPTHLAFKRSSCFLPFRKNTRTSGWSGRCSLPSRRTSG